MLKVFKIVILEKLTRTQLISLAKNCDISLKSQYELNKLNIIRKIRKSKIEENKLQNIFLQYVNLYFCEYCHKDHYFGSDLGRRHLNYQKDLTVEGQRAVNHKIIRSRSKYVVCNHCGKNYLNERFLKKHNDNAHFAPIDLHRMTLKEAIIYVESKLEGSIDRSVGGLKLIHGYPHGTILREYFRSEKFKLEMKRGGLITGLSNIRDLGYTLVRVNMIQLQKGKYHLS